MRKDTYKTWGGEMREVHTKINLWSYIKCFFYGHEWVEGLSIFEEYCTKCFKHRSK